MSDLCSECGASFASAAELVEHQRAHHTGPLAGPLIGPNRPTSVRVACAICGARFSTPEALAAHNRRPHAPRSSVPSPMWARPRPE